MLNILKVFSYTDYAYNEKFIKQGMFSGNHSKIDITGKGVKGPAGPPGPKVTREILVQRERSTGSKRRNCFKH